MCGIGRDGDTYDERVSLSSEDLDRVNTERLTVDTVDFDDSEVMVIDGENPIGVTRDGDQTETVAGSRSCQYGNSEQ